MTSAERKSLTALPLVLLVGALLAWAGSHHGASRAGLPVFATAVAAAFVIQWVAFSAAYRAQTERYFDLTGSLTYIGVTLLILVLTRGPDARALLLAGFVVVWAARLGTFLFRRISRHGTDDRFDAIKPSFVRFITVWTVQGLWVSFTAAAAWVAMSSGTRAPLGWSALAGSVVWLIGFALEVVADLQKSRFRADPANKGRFISTGLWSRSRHPNYFGEILLWVGVAIVAAPVLRGWQWVALLSPVFVIVLLTRVSGIPLLERKAEATWGDDPAYRTYRDSTPVLIPRW